MTWEYIEIGATPCDEECAAVGTPDYSRRALAECRRYIDLLNTKFGPLLQELGLQECVVFTTKGFEHDFGRYYEVVARYVEGNEQAAKFAYLVEGSSPTNWQDNTPITLMQYTSYQYFGTINLENVTGSELLYPLLNAAEAYLLNTCPDTPARALLIECLSMARDRYSVRDQT